MTTKTYSDKLIKIAEAVEEFVEHADDKEHVKDVLNELVQEQRRSDDIISHSAEFKRKWRRQNK